MSVRKIFASCSVLFVLIQLIPRTKQASIGDGSVSLYTGALINLNDTRGSCLVDGLLFPSETTIPRDHPCHYCICYQAQVTCYWKQCGAPPNNCEVMTFENVCNPSLYVCEIPSKAQPEPVFEFGAKLNVPAPLSGRRTRRKIFRRRLSRAAASFPPRDKRSVGGRMLIDEGFPVEFQKAWDTFLLQKSSRSRRAIESYEEENSILTRDTSCTVLGVTYFLGEVIGVASDVCMECRCAAGNMFCSPKCCFLPSSFSIPAMQWEGNSVFVRARDTSKDPPHPLYYSRNQYEKGTFI